MLILDTCYLQDLEIFLISLFYTYSQKQFWPNLIKGTVVF